MNKYKLQFNSHFGSSDLGAIPCENHCQFTVQAHSCLDYVFIHLPSVLGSFFSEHKRFACNLLSLTCIPLLKNEQADDMV